MRGFMQYALWRLVGGVYSGGNINIPMPRCCPKWIKIKHTISYPHYIQHNKCQLDLQIHVILLVSASSLCPAPAREITFERRTLYIVVASNV